MCRRTVSSSLFLALMLGAALNIPLVSGSATIYIRADGSVYPPDAPILNVGNVYYSLTANIYDSIVVERDNIVVDGAGYTLQGTGNGTGIDLSGRKNVTIKNMEIRSFDYGIDLSYSAYNNTVSGNNITESTYHAIKLFESSNNTISGNNITQNNDYSIWLYKSSGNNSIYKNYITGNYAGIGVFESSSNNTIAGNKIDNNSQYGLVLFKSSNNTIFGNNVTNNGQYGIRLFESSYNHIYHNNFINTNQVNTYNSVNAWNESYPSAGNYWSDYTGVDEKKGPNQDQLGSDGIGDTPYIIDTDNQDNYPLMNPWAVKRTEVGGDITEDTNWTVENSPYFLVEDVKIKGGATLTIEPGVTVNLDLYSLIIENGTLYARGDENNRIKIQSSEKPLHAWPPRIYFADASTPWNETSETGCIIEYAEINCINYQYETIMGGFPKISNNLILNYGNDAAAVHTDGTVSNNTVMGGYGGVAAENASILYNVIKDTQYGVLASGTMPGPTHYPVIIGNLIIDNHEGISFGGPSCPYIANNTIVRNTYGFRFTDYAFYDGAMPVGILHNNIHSNDYNVLVEKEDSHITINMTYNWWGTTNTSLINQKIYDQNDNRKLSAVNYLPLLTSPCASLDVTAPSTRHDYDGLWHNTDFVITLTAADDLSGIKATYYKLNNGQAKNVQADGQPFIATEDANNTLEYWSVDNTGNEELPHKILTGIKLDKTPPTGYVLINNDDPDTTTLNVTLSLWASDATSGVSQMRLSNDGTDWTAWEAYATSKAWTLSSGEGTKTVYAQFKDIAGLVSPTYNDTIIVRLEDVDPPITTISLSGIEGNNGWFTSNVTVILSATDDNSGVNKTEYSFDNSTWIIYKTPFNIANEGNTIIYYKSTDNAGNIETTKTEIIRIDKTAPSGSITINDGATYTTTTTVTLTLSATDATSGVTEMRFSNNNITFTEWQTYTTSTPWTLQNVDDGTKTVYVQFKDHAGLISTDSDTIILDIIPPTGSIIIAEGATYTNSTLVTLTLCADDMTSGVSQMRFSHNNITWTSWEDYAVSKAWDLPTGDGEKTVYVQFKDNAGLISQSYTDAIILDTTPPSGSISIAEGSAYTNTTSVTLTLTATDATSGIAEMCFSNDNAIWSDWEAYATSKSWILLTGDGIKTVTVQYRDNAGLISFYSDTIILDTTKPTANAGTDQTVAEDTLVTFDGSASTDENGIAGYTWTFTDATPQTLSGKNPTYTFTTLGRYTVTLKVTDPAGNSATDTVIITVLDITKPIANAGPDQTVDEDTIVTFDGSTSSDNVGIISYTWTFTDAGTLQTLDGLNPTYTFQTPGIYTVTLNVTDAEGNYATDTVTITVLDITKPVANAGADRAVNEDISITLDGSASTDNVGIASYTWTFTDVIAKTLTGEKPAYVFSTPGVYTITLNVTDANGNWATDTVLLTVLDTTEPIANAGSNQTVNVDETVTFDASGSSDNVGIVSYAWDFGDGATGTAMNPTHTYTEPGTYTVTLNVSDSAGNWGTDDVAITVLDATAPVADAGPDQTVDEDTLVTFDGSGSIDNVGISSYTWSFVDVTSQTLTGTNPTYTFDTPGVYTVTLNVSDATGNWATDFVVVTVLDVTNPIANAGEDQTVSVGETVTFNAGASSDNVGIISYAWDFGDGATGTGITTTHTYTKLGTYTITLTVKDAAGNTDTCLITITALPHGSLLWIVGATVAVLVGIALVITIVSAKKKTKTNGTSLTKRVVYYYFSQPVGPDI